MELTLENLIDEIVGQEYRFYLCMIYSEKTFGKDSNYYNYWETKWSVLHDLAVKFNFVNKLKR